MSDTKRKIAAGLERAFIEQGFAEPGVDDLKTAAGVSLRTLYKYYASREDMILGALEHRHQRYLALLQQDLPKDRGEALDCLVERMAHWMRTEAVNGCLFQSAVAAHPDNTVLKQLLDTHKAQVAETIATTLEIQGQEVEITLLHEGLLQTWGLHGQRAADAAKPLFMSLIAHKEPGPNPVPA
ncbi:TetR/AcrR family transcriptional regulator [Pseudovibrio exalbescens]|uniref:TetR/AcrR family transcriptional regulator n=1 Tax=Pseudovibrio exalbescens TaxID=197461 RepID=UPI000C9C5392|nr:TetR/AcrR family transcriptional regulator [Pseudovibrio exalbescens]